MSISAAHAIARHHLGRTASTSTPVNKSPSSLSRLNDCWNPKSFSIIRLNFKRNIFPSLSCFVVSRVDLSNFHSATAVAVFIRFGLNSFIFLPLQGLPKWNGKKKKIKQQLRAHCFGAAKPTLRDSNMYLVPGLVSMHTKQVEKFMLPSTKRLIDDHAEKAAWGANETNQRKRVRRPGTVNHRIALRGCGRLPILPFVGFSDTHVSSSNGVRVSGKLIILCTFRFRLKSEEMSFSPRSVFAVLRWESKHCYDDDSSEAAEMRKKDREWKIRFAERNWRSRNVCFEVNYYTRLCAYSMLAWELYELRLLLLLLAS